MKLFEPGVLRQTSSIYGLSEKDKAFRVFIQSCLGYHLVGHWGVVEGGDWLANNDALGNDGERLFSTYIYKDEADHDKETRIWIITESDRSVTTVLLPGDY